MANAGRVAIVPKGDYSSSVTYKRLDLVRYNNKAYVAKKASTGVVPTNTDYWMLMTNDGITIDSALSDTSTNPVQNKVIKTAVDSIQTTSRATLSQAGWYRVAEYLGKNADHLTGSNSNSCIISIKRSTWNKNGETSLILLNSRHKNQDFKVFSSYSGYHLLTKIRYAYDSEKAYIDVYYDNSASENCRFDIISGNGYDTLWQAITPTLTAETVDGVTVTTTYDIPANASPVTDLDLAQVDGSGDMLNTSILEKALEVADGVHNFRLDGGYTGDDLPQTNYRYGMATIYKRSASLITIVLWGRTNYKPQFNTYGSGAWSGWQELATTAELANYLPLSGGALTGNVQMKANSDAESTRTLGFQNNDGTSFGVVGAHAFNGVIDYLYLGTSYQKTKNLSITADELKWLNNDVHHSGNSAKVVVSATAPSDTSSVWVDRSNKVSKVYIDGAWTQVS